MKVIYCLLALVLCSGCSCSCHRTITVNTAPPRPKFDAKEELAGEWALLKLWPAEEACLLARVKFKSDGEYWAIHPETKHTWYGAWKLIGRCLAVTAAEYDGSGKLIARRDFSLLLKEPWRWNVRLGKMSGDAWGKGGEYLGHYKITRQ